MDAIRITQAELLEAIADASGGTAPKDARTVAELVLEVGRSDGTIQKALRTFAAQGRLVCHRVQRKNIAGVTNVVPAYTVLPAKRKR